MLNQISKLSFFVIIRDYHWVMLEGLGCIFNSAILKVKMSCIPIKTNPAVKCLCHGVVSTSGS